MNLINILIPMAGKSIYFSDSEYPFPKPLIEFGSRTMIELVIENLKTVSKNVNFIFVLSESECNKYHLDKTINIITNRNSTILKLKNETRGAACSCLLAIEYINNDIPLLIVNSDQIIDYNISQILDYFQSFDAGVLTFESVHPRWSYVELDEQNHVIQASEKKPISKNAIAGFYYIHKGSMFVENAMKMIIKNDAVNELYYIAPVLNQLILSGLRIGNYQIDKSKFHTFYNPQKIDEYRAEKK